MDNLKQVYKNMHRRYNGHECPPSKGIDCFGVICNFEKCWNDELFEVIEKVTKDKI